MLQIFIFGDVLYHFLIQLDVNVCSDCHYQNGQNNIKNKIKMYNYFWVTTDLR